MKLWLMMSGVAMLASCSSFPEVNSEPKYTTEYGVDDVEFRGVPISKYSDATRRHLFIYHFEVPPEVIFEDAVRLTGFAPVRWDDNGTGIEGPGKGTIRWVEAAGTKGSKPSIHTDCAYRSSFPVRVSADDTWCRRYEDRYAKPRAMPDLVKLPVAPRIPQLASRWSPRLPREADHTAPGGSRTSPARDRNRAQKLNCRRA